MTQIIADCLSPVGIFFCGYLRNQREIREFGEYQESLKILKINNKGLPGVIFSEFIGNQYYICNRCKKRIPILERKHLCVKTKSRSYWINAT